MMAGVREPMENVAKPKFDDLMLAMDAVDTIRFESSLLENELSGDDRRDALKVRLREYYAGQGIEVSDEILSTAVADMDKNRFVHEPMKPGLAKTIATIYVRRVRYAKRTAILAVCLSLFIGAEYGINREFVVKPRERAAAELKLDLSTRLPAALSEAYDNAVVAATKADDEASVALADNQKVAVEKSIAAGDAVSARKGISKLVEFGNGINERVVIAALMDDAKAVVATVRSKGFDAAALASVAILESRMEASAAKGNERAYAKDKEAVLSLSKLIETPLQLRIVDREGTRTGVWRTNDGGSTKVYYLVVEALDPAGRPVPMDIKSNETGRTTTVTTFAVRVPKSEYDRVGNDKQSDGVVDERDAGSKPAGTLEFKWNISVQGGGQMITSW